MEVVGKPTTSGSYGLTFAGKVLEKRKAFPVNIKEGKDEENES